MSQIDSEIPSQAMTSETNSDSSIGIKKEDDQSTSLESLPSVQSQSGSVTEGTPKHRISQLLPPQSQNSAQEPRRTSSRSIKRKKFDDEVVESSLIKTERGRMTKLSTVTQVLEKLEPAVEKEQPPAPPPEKKKVCTIVLNKMVSKSINSAAKRAKKQKTNDLTAVHLGVKFSCRFTLKEIQERWYALLYDPIISKLAVQAMNQLHPDVVAEVQSRALYSTEEESLMGTVSSTSQPTVEIFQELLEQNPDTFYPLRTAKALHNHWLLLKQYHLLPDQSVQPIPRGDHVLNFSDAEEMMNDEELREPKDDVLEQELSVSDRRNKNEIRHLEQELPKWQVLVDSVTGISPQDFDNQTLAVLRGRLVRYLMRSKEITLGRATKDNQIDVDLSLEGPAWKISRRQGIIKLRSNGDFFLANEGKRPFYVDGKAILAGNKQKLNNNSVVEISSLRFIFLINQDLINVIRTESQKLVPT
uniref:Microspherule protein 1 n=1 Tax=Magallana gigas TaxID=29159 RepID=K1P367_MAGGI